MIKEQSPKAEASFLKDFLGHCDILQAPEFCEVEEDINREEMSSGLNGTHGISLLC